MHDEQNSVFPPRPWGLVIASLAASAIALFWLAVVIAGMITGEFGAWLMAGFAVPLAYGVLINEYRAVCRYDAKAARAAGILLMIPAALSLLGSLGILFEACADGISLGSILPLAGIFVGFALLNFLLAR
jgi:hypothetical protein